MIASGGVCVERPESAAGERQHGVRARARWHAHVQVLVETLDEDEK